LNPIVNEAILPKIVCMSFGAIEAVNKMDITRVDGHGPIGIG
jgi:hypothetical protein